MDHEILIRCRISKLEESRIQPGESPDELVDRLRTLADRCNFPSEDEKEWNVQYRLVRALDDRDLVKKLLALPIKETTAKMLEVCRTHIAINGEMEAMGLGSSKTVHAIQKGPRRKDPPKDSRDHHNDDSSSSNTPVETVLYSTPLDEPPAQPKMPSVVHVEKLDTGSASVGQPKDNK